LNASLDDWVKARNARGPIAVILGGSVNGLSFARSLGRRRIPTLLLAANRFLGIYTRYAKCMLLPSIDESPAAWLDLLTFVGSRLHAPGVLFATSDASCLFVARHAEVLGRYFRFEIPDVETIERIVDKRSQYEIARNAGIAIPETCFPDTEDDVRHVAHRVSYPRLLKPYRSELARRHMQGRKVTIVGSPAELIAACRGFAEAGVPVMVQEIIPGEDSSLFGYLALWDREGRELASVTKRKLRQFPRHYGDGSLQVTVDEPEVADLATGLLRALNFRGFGCVEFKFDARDRTYRLVECNPRTASGNQLAITAGVDFPWLGYRYLTDTDPGDGRPRARPGIRHVNEEWDLQAYLALRRSGALGLRDWLRSIRGAESWAIGALDDPLPILMGFWRFLKQRSQSRP